MVAYIFFISYFVNGFAFDSRISAVIKIPMPQSLSRREPEDFGCEIETDAKDI